MALANLSAQENTSGQTDSLVRLLKAKYIEQIERGSDLVRKSLEPTFLHNGTTLICDSSEWSENNKLIRCLGHVRMLQGETELTSDRLDYFIEKDLAQFRGTLVELRNAQGNILRTTMLDYNTKDSIAVFFNGASMVSENDDQVIESDKGSYLNAQDLFIFRGRVNMYTDSVFVRTDSLRYDSKAEKAWFVAPIDFWKDENMLSSRGGWYERGRELFFFDGDVHGLTDAQETWSDSLYYYRSNDDVLMLGNVQVQDTSRSVAAVADYMFYQDSVSRVTMRDRAAASMWSETNGKVDTTYFGADTLIYRTIRKCDIHEDEIEDAQTRLESIMGDPVSEFRNRAAAAAAKAAEESAGNRPGQQKDGPGGGNPPSAGGPPPDAAEAPKAGVDSLGMAVDSLGVAVDSLGVAVDSLVVPPDTSKIGFLEGIGNVKVFRSDMQVRCDSLRYNDLDSIARLYINPIVWNEARRQYTSDSLYVLVKNNKMDRAYLISNAFIAVREDSIHFDQIKSAEILAYFDDDTALERFDALGGVNAVFYIEENATLATVNKVEGKMLSATMKDGDVERVYYYENPKNDAYPIVQISEKDQLLKGLDWKPDNRPKSRLDITDLEWRQTEREAYERHPRTTFFRTKKYFPGFIDQIYHDLEEAKYGRDTSRIADQDIPPGPEPSASGRPLQPTDRPTPPFGSEAPDSLSAQAGHFPMDSLSHKDGFPIRDSLSLADSLAVRDSVQASSTAVKEVKLPTAKEMRAADRARRAAEAEQRRMEKQEAREARWAELDAKDAARDAARQAKKEARQQAREEKRQKRLQKQFAKEDKELQKYIEYYQNKKNKEDERNEKSQPAGELPQGTEAGGDLQTPAES